MAAAKRVVVTHISGVPSAPSTPEKPRASFSWPSGQKPHAALTGLKLGQMVHVRVHGKVRSLSAAPYGHDVALDVHGVDAMSAEPPNSMLQQVRSMRARSKPPMTGTV